MNKFIVIFSIVVVGVTATWYFDILHGPVEKIDELIGQNYDYALKMYFQTDPDNHYKVNINTDLNEFDGGVLNKKKILTDSIVYVFTWDFVNHKKTIWIGETKRLKREIIDAIRYNDNVKF